MSVITNTKETMKERQTVNIYGAGGCGINIATMFQEFDGGDGFAKLCPIYLDTSRSNIEEQIPDSQCFIIPDMDGSGKIRAENAGEISSHISKVLDTHKPAKFNIVVFSTSGGTGSVFGPLLARELARRAVPQVIIAVSESDSGIACENTFNTYKTLESVYRGVGQPLIISWHKNCPEKQRPEVDEDIKIIIEKLAILASGQNHELDSRDLTNWVYYTRPRPSMKPQLCLLTITDDAAIAKKVNNPLSAVNLLTDASAISKELNPEYSTNGYIPSSMNLPTQGMVYVASTGEVETISKSVLEDYEKAIALSKERAAVIKPLLSEDDTVTEDGLVL